MAEEKKRVIVIAGPTAVGKTSVAIALAKQFQTEIISADSRQCFRELNIGVARPSEEELQEVTHHFVASHSVQEKVTAAVFEKYVLQKAEEIFEKNHTAIMVGGTGLYIRAFSEGLDEIPDVPDTVRQQVIDLYHQNGLAWLQEEVKACDPEFFKKGENKNPQRLMRALEVVKATGRSILDFRKGRKEQREFDLVKIALELPREELHRNIETRVDMMMQAGLLEEVRSLIPYQHLNALQTVGYKELFQHFSGETDLATAVEWIKRHTKQYAKRQMTWFRKDKEYVWTQPDAEKILALLHKTGKL